MTIDWWTLGFQTVNVLVLTWLLARFFWRPLAAMIALRRTTTQQAIDAAEAKRAEAAAALDGIAETRAGFAKERAAILDAARTAAGQERAAGLEQARTDAAALAAAGTAQLAKDATVAEHAWTDRASRLAVEIASRLLSRLDHPALHEAFLNQLLQQTRALPLAERQAIAPDDAAMVAVSAEPLDPAEQARCRTAVLDALQTRPQITFEVDAGLIGGLELHGPHAIVSNSLRADLDRILLELTHDDR